MQNIIPSFYHQHRQKLNNWLQQIHNKIQQQNKQLLAISSQIITYHIYTILKKIQKHTMKQQKQQQNLLTHTYHQQVITLQQLWQKNQHFMQCLKDYSQDLIYYVYGNNQSRNILPKCLIGYYQLIKNIVSIVSNMNKQQKYMQNNKHQQSLNRNKKTKQQINRNNDNKLTNRQAYNQSNRYLPVELQQYSCQKLFRLLLSQSPFSYLRTNLDKLQQSLILTKTFYSQLSILIIKRFEYLCKLFLISSTDIDVTTKLNNYFLTQLIQNGDNTNQQQISISIDNIILCIIYSVYRINRYNILFGDILSTYEKQCQYKIDRQKLLQFYNTQFIIQLFPKFIVNCLKIMENYSKQNVMLNKNQYQFDKDQYNSRNNGFKIMSVDNLDNHMKDEGKYNRNNKEISINMKNSGLSIIGFRYEQVNQQKSIFDMFQ